jgi:feruloyl esterase
VLEACDLLDGVKDGVLENPLRCRFDPKSIQCHGDDTSACLTAPQVKAARKIYAGATHPRTGLRIWPGLMPGSELGWGATAGGPEPIGLAVEYFKWVVFENPNWDWKTFDFDADTERTEKLEYGMNATDPNLKPFMEQGGKLLLYHGWSDPLISPQNSINYYKSLTDTMGGPRRLRNSPGSLWCLEWDTAAAAKDRTVSTPWQSSNNGWKRARRQTRSSPRDCPTASRTAHGPSVPIR